MAVLTLVDVLVSIIFFLCKLLEEVFFKLRVRAESNL